MFFAVITCLLCTTGCQPPKQLPLLPPLTRDEAIDTYNSNAANVPSFKAQITRWEVHFIDKGKATTHKDSSGKFFYQRGSAAGQAEMFYLQADTTLASKALVLASDANEYWMISKPASRGWWARHSNKDKPCAQFPLLHPDSLLELLGLKTLRPYDYAFPMPLYRLHSETFTIDYVYPVTGGLYIRKEIIFDRHSNLPATMHFYHTDGKLLVTAELANYQTIADVRVPGDILLTHPGDGAYLKLKLRKFKPDQRDLAKLLQSSRRMHNIETIQQLDKNCDNEPTGNPPQNP